MSHSNVPWVRMNLDQAHYFRVAKVQIATAPADMRNGYYIGTACECFP